MFKRFSFTLMAVALALGTLSASFGTAFAKSTENNESGTTVDVTTGHAISATLGHNGINIASSPYTGEMELARTKSTVGDHLRGTSAKFVDSMLTLTVDNNTLERQKSIQNANGYIYFDLTKGEQAMWQANDLSIYGYNPNSQAWSSLSTHWVSEGATGYGRLVAPAASFSAFALGSPNP
jgi:hypothetical protein